MDNNKQTPPKTDVEEIKNELIDIVKERNAYYEKCANGKKDLFTRQAFVVFEQQKGI